MGPRDALVCHWEGKGQHLFSLALHIRSRPAAPWRSRPVTGEHMDKFFNHGFFLSLQFTQIQGSLFCGDALWPSVPFPRGYPWF